ncbi:hypothetical protein D3C83_264840 [compost metagenome]
MKVPALTFRLAPIWLVNVPPLAADAPTFQVPKFCTAPASVPPDSATVPPAAFVNPPVSAPPVWV